MTDKLINNSSDPDDPSSDENIIFSDDRLNDLLNESSFLFKLLLAVTFFLLTAALIHMGWAMALRTTKYLFP